MIGRFVGFGVGLLNRHGDAKQAAGQRHGFFVRGTGEQAVMPDPVEAARQDVAQEAADELVGGQRRDLLALATVAAIILVPERHAGLVEGDEAPVRDGNAVRVAREIGQHRLRPDKGRLGIDHPALLSDGRQMLQEGLARGQTHQGAEEAQPAGIEQRQEAREEQPAEQCPQHAHRQQECGARRDPARAVERDAAAGHDHVHMRMVRQRRSPRMQHGGNANPRAEVLGVGRDGQHRVRGSAEQQVVDHRLVLPGNVGDLGRHREHDVEVADRQQIGLTRGQPGARGSALALT